jgi:sulfoxide reductase heme-binding subunit YedZ
VVAPDARHRNRAPWLLDLHRFLGGATVVFVVLHLLSLWADSYVTFGFRELLVPMASTWKPGAVTLGLVAFYLLIAVEATSLVMQRLPRRLWHAVHLSSYLVFVAGSAHLLWAGTDADHIALRATVAIVAAATLFFLVYRLVGPGRRASARPAPDLQST